MSEKDIEIFQSVAAALNTSSVFLRKWRIANIFARYGQHTVKDVLAKALCIYSV